MKWLIYLILIVLVIILEMSVFRVFNLGGFTPDLILLLTLAMVWSTSNYDYLIFALAGGIWLEFALGLPIGSITIACLIIGTSAYLILHRWFFSEKSWQYFLVAVLAGTIFLHLWLWLYSQVLFVFLWSPINISFAQIWRNLAPALLVNLLLIYPVYVLLELSAGLVRNVSKNRIKI